MFTGILQLCYQQGPMINIIDTILFSESLATIEKKFRLAKKDSFDPNDRIIVEQDVPDNYPYIDCSGIKLIEYTIDVNKHRFEVLKILRTIFAFQNKIVTPIHRIHISVCQGNIKHLFDTTAQVDNVTWS